MAGNTVQVKINTREFRRDLRAVGYKKIPGILARTLTKVAFEVRLGLVAEAYDAFELSNKGSSLLGQASAYTVLVAHANDLKSVVVAKPRSNEILAPHVRGDTIQPTDAERLRMRMGGAERLAIPLKGTRTERSPATGTVAKSYTPSALIERYGMYTEQDHVRWKNVSKKSRSGAQTGKSTGRGRLFVSRSGSVYLRAKKKGGELTRLYRLVSRGRLRKRFHFIRTVKRVAQQQVDKKFRYVLDKELGRGKTFSFK